MRLDDRVYSGWFPVAQEFRQRYVLTPLLFNVFSAAVINVAYTRFKADKDITDALVHMFDGVLHCLCFVFTVFLVSLHDDYCQCIV